MSRWIQASLCTTGLLTLTASPVSAARIGFDAEGFIGGPGGSFLLEERPTNSDFRRSERDGADLCPVAPEFFPDVCERRD